MLRLIPLEETTNDQELIKNERVAILTRQATRKFVLSDKLVSSIQRELEELDWVTLQL